MDESKIILCRCENFTVKDLHRLIDSGMNCLQEIKKECRCTMGPCQGRTCKEMIAKGFASYTGRKMEDLDIPVSRIPIKPITLGQIAGGA